MSRSIWTQCAAKFNFRTLSFDAWRVVESQHITSTRKLVDSDAEQEPTRAARRSREAAGAHWRQVRAPPLFALHAISSSAASSWLAFRSAHGAGHLVRLARSGNVVCGGCLLSAAFSRWNDGRHRAAHRRALRVHGVDHVEARSGSHASAIFCAFENPHQQNFVRRNASGGSRHCARRAWKLFSIRRRARPSPGVNVGLFVPAFAKKSPKKIENLDLHRRPHQSRAHRKVDFSLSARGVSHFVAAASRFAERFRAPGA